MNILKIGVCGIFYVLGMTLLGQNKFEEHKTIEWLDPVNVIINDREQIILQFDNLSETDPETNLPVLYESIQLPSNISPESIEVSIKDCQFIWPTPIEHTAFSNKVKADSIHVNFSISQSGKEYFAEISLTPLQQPKNALSFQKLISYTLEISYHLKSENLLKSSSTINSYAENSVLSHGRWFKVQVSESGIYQISYSTLQNWGISNPQNVGVYGNGGKMIPAANNDYRDDDLVENAIWHSNNSIYFYAEGPTVWNYNSSLGFFIHQKHKFSNHSYYFITEKDNSSRAIEKSGLQSETFEEETNYFNDFDYHETDNLNLIKSGNVWYGEKFDYYSSLEHNFTFSFPNIKNGSTAHSYLNLAARSNKTSSFSLELNGFLIGSTTISNISINDHIGHYARKGYINSSFDPNSDKLNLSVKYSPPTGETSSLGYLDYICINVLRDLTFVQDQLQFRNIDVTYSNDFVKYNLNNSNNNIVIWDITNPLSPLKVNHNTTGLSSNFIYNASELHEFVAFNPSGNIPSPTYVGEISNQNLHATPNVNYVIVCHPDFLSQAQRLGEIHKSYSGISYTVATTDQIYNEFSSGKPDVTAIRSFVKMFYDRAGNDESKKPKNLLLFGDGSYDNRENIANNTNRILTYQSDNSTHQTNSYVSDDYFGSLDDFEGANIQVDKLDIGIGRFPVNTIKEATNAVDRTYKYFNEQALEFWKSQLTFIADDGDNNIHMRDANRLTIKVDENHPEYNISKVYFDAYKKVPSSIGKTIPEVENKIYNALHEGTLLFNYTGHGGSSGLAHEHVITKFHIEQWKNINKLALFITATCEFSRFDEKEETSAGEMVFLNPLGGGIALFSTTRIVYSSLNYILNNNFYNHVFELDDNGDPLTLGEIMKRTKHNSGTSVNKLNFILLGDPAIQLIYPRNIVNTVSINDKEVSTPLDSIKALSHTYIEGNITDALQVISDDFDGEVFISVYDKPILITTRGNEGATPFQFETYNNIIFKGRSTVSNGEFESEFIVPQDIRYNFDNAKISYYAYSNNDEAFGAFNDIIVGGIDKNNNPDDVGPEIEAWLNNKSFKSGKQTTPTPLLIVDIFDDNGINTTGNGIGHDLTCVIDENTRNPIVLNNFFQADLNSFKSGIINYQLPFMESGIHNLKIKAWDTYNNSSEKTIRFNVSSKSEMTISKTTINPNPVVYGIPSYFYFEHDEPNSSLNINILVYSIGGQLVSSKNTSVVSLNHTVPPIEWSPTTTNGSQLLPGIYIYQLIITSQTGRKGKVSGKIMVTP